MKLTDAQLQEIVWAVLDQTWITGEYEFVRTNCDHKAAKASVARYLEDISGSKAKLPEASPLQRKATPKG